MGQAAHSRLLFPNVPKSQLLQDAVPSSLVVSPMLHCWHRVKSGSSGDRNQPIGHFLQPTPKLPAPHAMHEALPLEEVYLPVEQVVHEACCGILA